MNSEGIKSLSVDLSNPLAQITEFKIECRIQLQNVHPTPEPTQSIEPLEEYNKYMNGHTSTHFK